MSVSEGERRLLIDGKLVEASGGATFPNVNPATEEVLGPTADGTAADMEAAVAAARRAFDTTAWATDHAFRAECLRQLQAAIEAEREELRAELVAEVGCPVLVTYGPQLDAPLREALTWPAEMIERFPWRRDLGPKDAFGMGIETEREVWKEPVGVVGVIVPWNFPVEITLNKLGPVLAMGNTCVLKPAPDTPWNATRIGRLVAEQHRHPAGRRQRRDLVGDHLVGEVLATSPLVDMVAFTGSTATGRRVMQAASANAQAGVPRAGRQVGQPRARRRRPRGHHPRGGGVGLLARRPGLRDPTRCWCPARATTRRSSWPQAGFEPSPTATRPTPPTSWAPSSPSGSGTGCSATSRRARRRGPGWCAAAAARAPGRGWYVEPTLFVDVDNAMTIAREEIFGPVLVIIPYEDDDDAVRIANDSPYGLSGAITSGDLERAKAVARRIRTGTLGINGGIWYGADAPFGGYKHSGIGRQCGIEGLEIFTETKTVGWPVRPAVQPFRTARRDPGIEVACWMFVPLGGVGVVEWGVDIIKLSTVTGDPQRGLITSGLLPGGAPGRQLQDRQPNRGKRSVARPGPPRRPRGAPGTGRDGRRLPHQLPAPRAAQAPHRHRRHARPQPPASSSPGHRDGPKGPGPRRAATTAPRSGPGRGGRHHARSAGRLAVWPTARRRRRHGRPRHRRRHRRRSGPAGADRRADVVDVSLLATAMWQVPRW